MVEEHGWDEYWRMRIRLVTEGSRTQGWRENTVAHMSCGECGFRGCNRSTCGCEGESPVVEVGDQD